MRDDGSVAIDLLMITAGWRKGETHSRLSLQYFNTVTCHEVIFGFWIDIRCQKLEDLSI